MNIKKFIARNNGEAIRMVKREMGPDAVILSTRTVNRTSGGGDSLERLEVTAAVDYDPEELRANTDPMDLIRGEGRLERLESELKEIRGFLCAGAAASLLNPEVYFNPPLMERFTHFKDFGLNPDVIRELMGEKDPVIADTETSGRRGLRECLVRLLRRVHVDEETDPSKGKRICSFIGPTGVGKTTTLAKLAAFHAVELKRKIALVTVDTFRIAAVAQLETYARIMSIPLEVATCREELRAAIAKHEDCDRILIDTAGRSPNNEKEIGEMREIFEIGERIHHYLVLSATTQFPSLLNAERRFGILPFESYIFTKLDEVDDASSMVNFLITRSKPVSYFTTGQQVPEDVEPASKRKVAEMILSRKRTAAGSSMGEVH
jgi:flagellar biosynthesis protein FlhF